MPMKIIIYIIWLNLSISIVVLPFKTSYVNKNGKIDQNSKEYNSTHFMNDYFIRLLYTTIEMGNPPQEIKVLITYEDCGYKIGLAKKCINDSNYLSHYDRNISKDFNFTDIYPYHMYEFGSDSCSAEDSIHLFTDTKLKKYEYFKKLGFYLGSDTDQPLCGVIGLSMNNYQNYCPLLSFISNLKLRDIIENYKWILNYTSDDEGQLIIGINMKDVIPKFDENKLFSIYSRKTGGSWSFDFDRIIIGDNLDEITYSEQWIEIISDFSFLIGSEKYRKYIEEYFYDEFEKGICSQNIYFYEFNKNYYIIECDKEKVSKEMIKNFPSLTFINRKLGTDIYFDGKQLFTETKYKYFFNVIFSVFEGSLWKFGQLFLKNYPVMMNLDQEVIEIYNSKEEDDNGKNSKNFSTGLLTLYIILIIVLVSITGVTCYFLGKYLNKMRKRKANELSDDEYDYTSKEEINRASENT